VRNWVENGKIKSSIKVWTAVRTLLKRSFSDIAWWTAIHQAIKAAKVSAAGLLPKAIICNEMEKRHRRRKSTNYNLATAVSPSFISKINPMENGYRHWCP
jgi:hypothetical protein